MLELTFLREHREEAEQRLNKRNIDAKALLDTARELDDVRRSTQTELDARLAEMNGLSRTIGELMKSGKKDEAEAARARTTELKAATAALKEKLDNAETALHDHLCTIPNAPSAKVPVGRTPEENTVVMEEGAKPTLHDGAKPHWELAEEYGLFSLDLGVKLTGAGFPVALRTVTRTCADFAAVCGVMRTCPIHTGSDARSSSLPTMPFQLVCV